MTVLILGADGAPRRNRPVVKIADRSAMADPQGLVEFGGIRLGKHALSASDGSSLYLRRGAEPSVTWIDFEVKQPTGNLDLGTVLAETYAEASARRTAAFGPACDAVVAGRRPPAPLPAEDLPACLERDTGAPWDDKGCPGGLGHLQLLCQTVNSRKVGTYTSGADAYDVRWTVSVLTAAGTVRSKSFSAPPPVMVKIEVGGVGGGYGAQLEKLEAARRGWLDSLSAKKTAGGG